MTPQRPGAALMIVWLFIFACALSTVLHNTGPGADCRAHTRVRSDGIVQHAAYYTVTLSDGSRWQVCRLGADDVKPWPERLR